ncbi:protein kinase [Streptomyces sp. NPDC005423]|uniref:serine/threonine-protein kinase n=1 Tax=Streptomyces sp. NPDC005423 TaxID=3155343 RepID=UPI0033AA0CFE
MAESIGQGGMGRVWRAADEMLDRQVAVKEMRIDGLDAEDTRTRRERTLREARATARIDHPNVVRVYDVVDEGERLWIVMELVVGRSLERTLAEDGPLVPEEAARIGLGLVSALRQVHAGGVLHRDIKPGNVLVESRGHRVVLTDFGIAAIQDAKALTMVGMLVGSPDYMAPERVSGRPQGPPSDLWSLGATLCAALGGRSPFSRDTTLATLHAVLYEEPELPETAGPLTDILAALLEKEPSVRPGLEDLESALTPIAHPPPPPTLTSTPTLAHESAPTPTPEPDSTPTPTPRLMATVAEGTPSSVAPEESPTPAYLDPSLVRAARDPRRPATPPHPDPDPDPDSDAGPGPVEDAVPPQLPSTAQESASTSGRAASELRSGSGSEASAANLRGAAPRPPGVSLVRAGAVTEPQAAPVPAPAQPPPPDTRPARVPDPAPPQTELPYPVTPLARRRPGRRSALIAAAGAVAVAGAVAGVVLATGGGGPAAGPHAGPSSRAASVSAADATPTGGPSSTVEGTARPPSLPAGTHREAGGFAWATPVGWRRDLKTGSEVHYTSPDGGQELVGKSSLAHGDLMETWETSERNARQGEDYRKIRLERTTFQGRPAVVWEYTFTLKGVAWHARLLGFDAAGKSYQVSTWYQEAVASRALKVYDRVEASFLVL